jgi:membrane-anchored protein YejM (alkaline phosphatase superfamily)
MAEQVGLYGDHRKTTLEMLGEFFREFALLILVFVPLEFFLQVHETYRWQVMIAAILVSSMLLAGGKIIERTRER